MKFVKAGSIEPAADYITKALLKRLNDNQKVLWIVTGGSNIKIATKVANNLAASGCRLKRLSITLSDERFGPINHADSNWQQLHEAGFIAKGAKLVPILSGSDLAKTANDFSNQLADMFSSCDYSIGIFGMGPDGHVAGILPGSPAINTSKLAAGYKDSELPAQSPEGVKRGVDRITMAPAAIAKLDEAVLCALGKSKHLLIDKLKNNLSLNQNPAQALKKAGKLIVYSD